MTARIGIVTFPGTLDDRDAARAVRRAGAEPVRLWHGDESISGVDAVVLPGGFSYGDYLRAGALSRFSPIMERVIAGARSGLPVLGVCNGFQILCETGLLAGALLLNEDLAFICREQGVRVENTHTAWTNDFAPGTEFLVPLKSQQGQFYADDRTLAELEGEGRVAFRYIGTNPNGSRNNIAGITNAGGNVLGLMPHPEHAIEAGFGPSTTGLRVFTSALTRVLTHA